MKKNSCILEAFKDNCVLKYFGILELIMYNYILLIMCLCLKAKIQMKVLFVKSSEIGLAAQKCVTWFLFLQAWNCLHHILTVCLVYQSVSESDLMTLNVSCFNYLITCSTRRCLVSSWRWWLSTTPRSPSTATAARTASRDSWRSVSTRSTQLTYTVGYTIYHVLLLHTAGDQWVQALHN